MYHEVLYTFEVTFSPNFQINLLNQQTTSTNLQKPNPISTKNTATKMN